MGKQKTAQAMLAPGPEGARRAAQARRTKFQVFGEEMIEKGVRQSGRQGRVYLPPDWVGKSVKIIRLD